MWSGVRTPIFALRASFCTFLKSGPYVASHAIAVFEAWNPQVTSDGDRPATAA